MGADGIVTSASSVERAMRRRGLLQPADYTGQRRELAKAREAAFADPPTAPMQVWQLDFSEYEITTGGIWRLAGVCDYYSKYEYEYGWHIAATCTGADAIASVRLAIAEADARSHRYPCSRRQSTRHACGDDQCRNGYAGPVVKALCCSVLLFVAIGAYAIWLRRRRSDSTR